MFILTNVELLHKSFNNQNINNNVYNIKCFICSLAINILITQQIYNNFYNEQIFL
jgi:hypothetical protein